MENVIRSYVFICDFREPIPAEAYPGFATPAYDDNSERCFLYNRDKFFIIVTYLFHQPPPAELRKFRVF